MSRWGQIGFGWLGWAGYLGWTDRRERLYVDYTACLCRYLGTLHTLPGLGTIGFTRGKPSERQL